MMRLVVAGAAGRMGRMLVKTISENEGTRVAGAFEPKSSAFLGQDAGILAGLGPLGVTVADDPVPLLAQADGLIDFTAPAASAVHAGLCADAGIVHVIGTTGLLPEHDAAVAAAAQKIAIVKSGNMSLGVNLLAALLRRAAASLGSDWDIEIVEMHHRQKVDAPSGTALLLGQAAAEGRGVVLDDVAVRARDGHTGARQKGAIGFQALRGGTVVGEHQAILAGDGERVVLGHIAEDRSVFARGAVAAALWAWKKPPGLYGMDDVLG